MSAIEIMRSIGRPIAYHPALARHVGGVNAAIFLCQLIYWEERADNGGLGVYKTAAEWEEETGLSYREQAGARKKLRDLGLVIETNQRLKHRIYYRLDHAAFNALMASISSNDESAIRQPTKAHSPNDENAFREQRKAQFAGDAKRSSSNDENAVRYIDIDYTETTAEITAETTSPSAAQPSRAPKATRLDDGWTLPADWLAWALQERPDWTEAYAHRVADQFRDYWCAKGGADARKVSWAATWRNWVRREKALAPAATNARQTFAQQRAQAEIDDFVNGPGDDNVIEMEARRVGD